ncbi:MAG: TetR/AcrR family transcriptional regulator [Sedimenticola sp.]|nr:TetR/AcrR family transcriptional regulator [Sedimenticola sp.]
MKQTVAPEPIDRRILNTALDLFVERGYHNVSVHDVQKQANVSIGSIYNHFGGKEGIAKALYYYVLNEMEALVNSVTSKDLGAIESCNQLIALLLEQTETHRNIIAFALHAKHREFLPEEPPICSAVPFKAMRDIVQKGMEQGEIRQCDPWVAAAAVFGGAIRLIHLRLDGVIEQPIPTLYDALVESTWQGMDTKKE